MLSPAVGIFKTRLWQAFDSITRWIKCQVSYILSRRVFNIVAGACISYFTHTTVTCEPLASASADCGVYEGVIQVYGSGGGILAVIKSHLSILDPQELHSSVIRIFTQKNSDPEIDDEITTDVPSQAPLSDRSVDAPEGAGDTSLSAGAILGIIAAILLAFGIGGFLFYQSKRRSQEKYTSPGTELYLENGDGLISDGYLENGDGLISENYLKNGDGLTSDGYLKDSDGFLSDGYQENDDGLISGGYLKKGDGPSSDVYLENGDGLISNVYQENGDGIVSDLYLHNGDGLLTDVYLKNGGGLLSDVHEESEDGLVSGDDDHGSIPTVVVEDGRPILVDHGYSS